MTYGHSGIDYRVASLSKSYLTVIGIIMQSLNTTILTYLNKRKELTVSD